MSRATLGLAAAWVLAFAGVSGREPAGPSALVPPAAVEQTPVPAGDHGAVMRRYCTGCHSGPRPQGSFRLDQMDITNIAANLEGWERVARKLHAGVMPPPGRPRPAPAEYQALRTFLETALDRAAVASPNPGRSDAFRRLNRTEYKNAVRDLLALDIDVAALLPPDDLAHGFDNTSLGELSPTLLERYLAAAKEVSRVAVGLPPRSAVAHRFTVPDDRTQEDHFEDLPFGTRGGVAIEYFFPLDAEYTMQVRLGRDREGYLAGLFDHHQLEVSLDGERVGLFELTPELAKGQYRTADPEQQQDAKLVVRVPVKAGPRQVAVTFLKRSSVVLETDRQPWFRRHAADYADQRAQPVVDSVTITGPFEPTGPGDTPSRRRVFSCQPNGGADEDACASAILRRLAGHAYRRPVTDVEVQNLMRFYTAAKAEGFEPAVEAALRALLVSPHFLFRIERDPAAVTPGTPYRLGDYELASRLSFFLWSSLPDEALLRAAADGSLRTPAGVERQVQRMLADERSAALVDNFAGQWLYLRNLESTQPDPRLYPDFDDGLRQAFRRETELFFDAVLRENRSALDLLNGDFTFVNERLAKHYGIPGIYGAAFRRVPVADEHRRGLLGHGSVLTATSYATRTSPVLRGVWILENILGTPPPPPPPDVPPLPEAKDPTRVLTMRERMAEHRSNAVCASCHATIDPAGFGLEFFDAVGKWRTHDEHFAAIDATGVLPDGTTFSTVAELRRALATPPDRFATTVTEKLMTYALGRGVEYYDMSAVRQIVRDSARDGYRLSSLILGIVKSAPFQMRRSSQS